MPRLVFMLAPLYALVGGATVTICVSRRAAKSSASAWRLSWPHRDLLRRARARPAVRGGAARRRRDRAQRRRAGVDRGRRLRAGAAGRGRPAGPRLREHRSLLRERARALAGPARPRAPPATL